MVPCNGTCDTSTALPALSMFLANFALVYAGPQGQFDRLDQVTFCSRWNSKLEMYCRVTRAGDRIRSANHIRVARCVRKL